MKTLFARAAVLVVLSSSVLLGGCGKGGPDAAVPGASTAIPAGKAAADAKNLDGKKVKIVGMYTQGYSNGGRDGDPWALVIRDDHKASDSVDCLIPKKVDIKSDAKLEAEGTMKVETTGRGGNYLVDCTYKILP